MSKHDVWALTANELAWDYSSYHISAVNEHDHSTVYNLPRSVRLPQSLLSQIMHWVSDPRTPYRSPADVIRDAIAHRLAFLAEREDGLHAFRGANNFLALQTSIQAAQALEAEMSATCTLIEARARELIASDQLGELVKLFEAVQTVNVEAAFKDVWEAMIEALRIKLEGVVARNL